MEKMQETMNATVNALTEIENKMREVARVEKKFDERLEELENKVDAVYDLNNRLSAAIARFENAVGLLKETMDKIPELEGKIEEVQAALDGLNINDLKTGVQEASDAIEKGLDRVAKAERKKEDVTKKTILKGKGKR